MRNGFPRVPLGEILRPVSRPESVDPGMTYRILGAHWYAKGLYIKYVKHGSEIQADKVYRVEHGDFVYNRLFAWKGSFALATIENHDCYVSNEFPCFAINPDRLDGRYLWRYFNRPSTWDEALGLSSGGTPTSRNRLKEERLLAMQIPLPSLREQRRIVARIQELASRIDETRKLRRQAADQAKALVNSLLSDIAKDQSKFLGQLGQGTLSARNGLSRRPSGTESGPIVLRLADVASGTISLKSPRRGDLSNEEARTYGLSLGDLLFLRVNGSRALVGRCIPVYGVSETVCFNDHLIRVRVDPNVFDWRFVNIMANGPIAREYMERVAITTAGQNTINHSMLAALPIPVSPLPDQRRIVAYVDVLQGKANTMNQWQGETAAELDALLPSILEMAFKGKL